MRSFNGSDKRFYRNELCLDTTNNETLASRDLSKLHADNAEKELLQLWNFIITEAKKTKKYDPKLTYGIYQIYAKLNTFSEDEITGTKIPDYTELNGHLKSLKQKIKEYYNSEIVPTLFKYEFLK